MLLVYVGSAYKHQSANTLKATIETIINKRSSNKKNHTKQETDRRQVFPYSAAKTIQELTVIFSSEKYQLDETGQLGESFFFVRNNTLYNN